MAAYVTKLVLLKGLFLYNHYTVLSLQATGRASTIPAGKETAPVKEAS